MNIAVLILRKLYSEQYSGITAIFHIILTEELATSRYNIGYLSNGIEFLSSGDYYITLQVGGRGDKNFRLYMSTDFTGSVNYCYLQRLPFKQVGSPDSYGITLFGNKIPLLKNSTRNCYNALAYADQKSYKIKYIDDNLTYKMMYLGFNQDINSTYEFNLTICPYSKVTIIYYYGSLDTSVIKTYTYTNNNDYNTEIAVSETFDNLAWASIKLENIYPI